jgi:DNA-binding protein YbaB
MQDKKMLEDLIVSAVNQAYRTAEANFEEIAKSKFSNQFMDKFSDFSKFQDKE